MFDFNEFRRQGSGVWGFVCGLVGLSLLALSGCGAKPAAPMGGTEDAGNAVSSVLDAWKSGLTLDDFRIADPSMHVADQDWQAGIALKDYQLLGTEKNGGNWRVSAVLTVAAEGQSARQRNVAYDVTTEPAITVLRAFDVED